MAKNQCQVILIYICQKLLTTVLFESSLAISRHKEITMNFTDHGYKLRRRFIGAPIIGKDVVVLFSMLVLALIHLLAR